MILQLARLRLLAARTMLGDGMQYAFILAILHLFDPPNWLP
jgi:hypothetical protein